jgi:glycosyltransferase involved in cell wall biosynthesis
MSEPLISICIPTYNGEEFLDQCLKSCIGQSYANYEIVVCDDKSSDATAKIIEKYCTQISKIRFIQNPSNLGLVGNWNKCMEEARGEWIKFVFQDDYISSDCLQEFVNNIDDNIKLLVSERNFVLPTDASSETRKYYEHGVRTLTNTCKNNSLIYSPTLISRIAVQNMCMNFIAEPSLSFFKKDIVSEIGFFNPALKQICDLEFLLRVASCYGLKYVPKKICSFRIHANTTTSMNLASNHFVLYYIERLLLSYFLLYDRRFSAFRKALGPYLTFRLWLYFRVRAYNAYRANQKENRNHFLFTARSEEFGKIWDVRKGNLFVRQIAKFFP